MSRVGCCSPRPSTLDSRLRVVHDLVVGLDHVLLRRRRPGRPWPHPWRLPRLRWPGRSGRAKPRPPCRRVQLLERLPDLAGVAGAERLPAASTASSSRALTSAASRSTHSLRVLLHLVDQRVEPVAACRSPRAASCPPPRAPRRPSPSCRSPVSRQPARGLDPDLLLLARGLVLGRARAGCRWRRCRT